MKNYCTHEDCRAGHRASLGFIQQRTGTPDAVLIGRVKKVNAGEVPCLRPFQEKEMSHGKDEANTVGG